jgi:hypothetical protein
VCGREREREEERGRRREKEKWQFLLGWSNSSFFNLTVKRENFLWAK